MGATIRPDIEVKRVSPVPAVCAYCKVTQWVAYEEFYAPRGYYSCMTCGEQYSFNPDFYPTEFPLTEMHLTYGSMHDMLAIMGVAQDSLNEDPYCGRYEVNYLKGRVDRLKGTRYHQSMVEIVNQAEKLGVDITWA